MTTVGTIALLAARNLVSFLSPVTSTRSCSMQAANTSGSIAFSSPRSLV
jgi:hypothetical protein